MAGIAQLTADQKEYLINGVATYLLFSDMKTELVDNQGVDGDFIDTCEASINLEAYKRRAFSDVAGFAGSDRQWAEVAWAQITPAPSGCAQSTFDTEGGEEIIILGSMFSPGCTATIGGEDITIISMTPGTILGITPALTAAADNDIVVTSAADNAGTLTPGPASAKKDSGLHEHHAGLRACGWWLSAHPRRDELLPRRHRHHRRARCRGRAAQRHDARHHACGACCGRAEHRHHERERRG